MLHARCRLDRGELSVHVDLEIEQGSVMALVGPNGSGKTSVVRAVAGLDPVADGVILVNNVEWSKGPSLHVEAAKRSTSLVLADPLLFPHMSIQDNVAFGLRARGCARKRAVSLAVDWLANVGLGAYATSAPSELSTGQQQRASLARALAIDPEVLLLDEPLSAQDLDSRSSLRGQLKSLLQEFRGMTLLVTHDPVEALSLAQRIAVLEKGRITQQGSPQDVVRRPSTPFVAKLLGLNLFRGVCRDGIVSLESGGTFVVADDVEGAVQVAFAPHTVTLTRPDPDHPTASSQRNRWNATVLELEPFQGKVRVSLSGSPSIVAEVTGKAVADLELRVGDRVEAAVKATEVEVYPA